MKPTGDMSRDVIRRQAAAYSQAIFDSYGDCLPLPAGDYKVDSAKLSEAWDEVDRVAGYAERDVQWTMNQYKDWYKTYVAPGPPVLINKFRGRAQQAIFTLNDLVHPSTIQAMSGPGVTSQPLWDDNPRGCGCVR